MPLVRLRNRNAAKCSTKNSIQREFENLFKKFDKNVLIHYLSSFGRARVQLASPDLSRQARADVNNRVLCGKKIKCVPLLVGNC